MVGQQTHFAQEIGDRRIVDPFVLTLLHKLMNGVQQLLHVLRAVDPFGGAVQCQRGHHARCAKYHLRKTEGIHLFALIAELIYHQRKSLQLLFGSRTHVQPCVIRFTHHIQIAPVVLDRVGGHFLHRRLADPSARKSDDTQQSLIVPFVNRETQVPQGVFDLLALVERSAAVDAVRDIEFAQLTFYHAALRVRAIENGERIVPFVPHSLDACRDT